MLGREYVVLLLMSPPRENRLEVFECSNIRETIHGLMKKGWVEAIDDGLKENGVYLRMTELGIKMRAMEDDIASKRDNRLIAKAFLAYTNQRKQWERYWSTRKRKKS